MVHPKALLIAAPVSFYLRHQGGYKYGWGCSYHDRESLKTLLKPQTVVPRMRVLRAYEAHCPTLTKNRMPCFAYVRL